MFVPEPPEAPMRTPAPSLMLLPLLLGLACVTPRLQVADPATLLKGDRILTYPLVADSQGEWHVGNLPPAAPGAFRPWPSGTGSLVLVFDVDGVLARHSLVVPR